MIGLIRINWKALNCIVDRIGLEGRRLESIRLDCIGKDGIRFERSGQNFKKVRSVWTELDAGKLNQKGLDQNGSNLKELVGRNQFGNDYCVRKVGIKKD